jgi:hypothetical protein
MRYNQHTRRTPNEWQAHFGIVVYDPDGWNRKATDWQAEWNRPMTESEFRERATKSTTGIRDKARYAYYWLNKRDGRRPPPTALAPELPVTTERVRIPLCHKCAHSLFANSFQTVRGIRAQEYKGCGLDARITTYDDAKLLCPILYEHHR